MKKHARTKLAISPQTIRTLALTPRELHGVAGGALDVSLFSACGCETNVRCVDRG